MKTIKFLLAILVSIAIAACGGGGGSSTPAPTYSISGTVTLSTAALSGVTITLSGASITTTTKTTAADGTYSFAGLAPGSYTVTPTLTGKAFTPASAAVSVSNANVSNTNFTATTAAATYIISGSAGIAGATITLNGGAGSTIAGTGGAYTIPGLVAGNYTLTASKIGFTFTAPITITGLAADSTGNNFTATAIQVAHALTGNVSPSLAGVTISAVNGATTVTATTNTSGNYSLNLVDGTYTVTPSVSGYLFAPNNASVTMAGAAKSLNFAATANNTIKATANGTVTGAWLEGVTITATGIGLPIQLPTGTTNASGNYSIGNLPSGQDYTFTATLAGYTYSTPQTVTFPAGSSTAVTVPAIVDSSTIASYSISGTVTYAGTKTGPVSVLVYNSGNTCSNGCSANGGTRIALTGSAGAYTGTYTIRGLQNSSYYVVATMDALGTGYANASDPVVNTSASPTTISSANATANLTLTDPATLAPVALPTAPQISPGDTEAFVVYSPNSNVPMDANGNEIATSYKIYWGTDTAASTGGGSVQIAAQGSNNPLYFLKGLTNGSSLYFKVTALVGSTETSPSTALVTGPVLIGAPTGANTVSGTVTFPIAAKGPMMLVLHAPQGSGNIYFTHVGSQASPPTSPASYSISAVPAGNYQMAIVVDNNNNGIADAGDFTYGFGGNGNDPIIAVSGNTTSNFTMSTVNALAAVQTSYYQGSCGAGCIGYNLNLGISGETKQPVNVTLFSGPNVAVPFDMGYDPNNNQMGVNLNGATPAPGDSYGFLVTYSDGTTQIISGSVSTVLGAANLAQSLVVNTTFAGGRTIPTFTWAAPAPASAPAAPYTWHVGVNGGSVNWWYPNNGGLPSTTLSALYNADGMASSSSLTVGTAYSWQVQIQDANGNQATIQAPNYTP